MLFCILGIIAGFQLDVSAILLHALISIHSLVAWNTCKRLFPLIAIAKFDFHTCISVLYYLFLLCLYPASVLSESLPMCVALRKRLKRYWLYWTSEEHSVTEKDSIEHQCYELLETIINHKRYIPYVPKNVNCLIIIYIFISTLVFGPCYVHA